MAGMTHGYGMPVGAGDGITGVGDDLGDGIAGAGTTGDGTLVGVLAGITGAGMLAGATVGTTGDGLLDGAMAGITGAGMVTIEVIAMLTMLVEEALCLITVI